MVKYAYVRCPRCNENISKNSINVVSVLYRNFKHECGFEGTFIWENPHPQIRYSLLADLAEGQEIRAARILD